MIATFTNKELVLIKLALEWDIRCSDQRLKLTKEKIQLLKRLN